MEFRRVLGSYASGVTVVSSVSGREPVGFTCQSFYSVSLQPPLVSFSVMTTSTTYPRVRQSGVFVVNVLAEDQTHIADQFARSGTDKWAGVSWYRSPGALPVISGALAWLECEIWAEHPAGDHNIVIGHVRAFARTDDGDTAPLIYYQSGYRELADNEFSSRSRGSRRLIQFPNAIG